MTYRVSGRARRDLIEIWTPCLRAESHVVGLSSHPIYAMPFPNQSLFETSLIAFSGHATTQSPHA